MFQNRSIQPPCMTSNDFMSDVVTHTALSTGFEIILTHLCSTLRFRAAWTHGEDQDWTRHRGQHHLGRKVDQNLLRCANL